MSNANPYESPITDGALEAGLRAKRGTDPFWVLAASAWTLLVTMLTPISQAFPDWLYWSLVGVSSFLVLMAALARPLFLLLVTLPIAATLTFVLRVFWLGRM